MNKDLVLREYLAIERTRLANETALLAYIRTGLYFLVAGSTLGHVIQRTFWTIAGAPLTITGFGNFDTRLATLFQIAKSNRIKQEKYR